MLRTTIRSTKCTLNGNLSIFSKCNRTRQEEERASEKNTTSAATLSFKSNASTHDMASTEKTQYSWYSSTEFCIYVHVSLLAGVFILGIMR